MIYLLWILFPIFSALIASSKGRSGGNWFFIGLLFGPFGLLVGLMPALNNTNTQSSDTSSNEIQDLKNLSDLKDKGIFSEEEFEIRKNQILNKPKPKEENTVAIGLAVIAFLIIISYINTMNN